MEDNFKDFVVEYADCRMLTVNLVYRMDYLPPGNQQDCSKRFVSRFLYCRSRRGFTAVSRGS